MFRRLLFIKHFLYALFALVGTFCAAEVVLQIKETSNCGLQKSARPDWILPSYTVHHSLCPHTTIQATNPDTNTTHKIRFNSFGLRGPEISLLKKPGTVRVLILGDDTIAGIWMNDTNVITNQLQVKLKDNLQQPVEVLNAGVPGYCPLLSYLQYRNQLAQLQPDLVIFAFDMSDVADDTRYRRRLQTTGERRPVSCIHPELLVNTERPSKKFIDRFVLTRMVQEQACNLLGNNTGSATDIHSKKLTYAWLENTPPDWSRYIDNTLSPIGELAKATAGMNIPFLVTVCPAPWQVSELACSPAVRSSVGVPENIRYSSRKPFDLLREYTSVNGILLCDASRAFFAIPDNHRLFMVKSRELSRYGHALYAREIASFVNANIPLKQDRRQYLTRPLANVDEDEVLAR